ncbi:hypothetical protein [Phenylobacterium sp.]|uniref:hypothetical protein n=1 Tax=Phenylobacterium sp. TaxID=1871053 RepID=UPI002E3458BE|nr:hypothetical protein [Phenylobacterium sp.]HEX2559683.1 hypothetical protein [Phenylobacterium sp.]
MTSQVHYGVVKQDGAWTIIGRRLRVGRYERRSSAISAARRLALRSAGLPVQLHIQSLTGELLPPVQVVPEPT